MIVSPLIDSPDVTLIQTIQVDKLIDDWQNTLNINIHKELKNYREIYLYKCNKTKLNFFYPYDIAGTEKLYEQLQKFEWYYMPDKWEYRIALENLLEREKILEIGCAFGYFVRFCIDAGLDIRGIELNKAAVIAAQKSHLPVEHIDLEEAASLYFKSLDAVCSFQVLEHVPNLRRFIDLSIQMLKPGGKLIYCVPNSESFLKYQYNLLDMPPHHMSQWSEFSFRALEKIFPVKLEKVIYEPLAPYHVTSYVTSYSSHCRSSSPLGKLFFNRYTLPLYEKCLSLGLRKLLIGQSLYVQFRKL